MSDPMKKAWEILKASDFQRFVVEVFDIPWTDSIKLTPSRGLIQAISQGKLTGVITENEFEELINLAEAGQYEQLLEKLEEINSNYEETRRKRNQERKKERYANDPEYRRTILEHNKKYAERPENKERKRKKDRERRKKKEEP